MLNNVNYIVWDIDPAVFSFSEAPRWYGVCWALGLFLSYYIVKYIFRQEGRKEDELDSLTLYVIAGTFLGARLGHVLFYDLQYFWQHPAEILLPFRFTPTFEFIGFAGLASHGATAGILLAIFLFTSIKKINYFYIVDRIAIVAALAAGSIRLGNLFNSEMIGTPTEVPWAFIFSSVDNIPRHPAQLYEAIFCFMLFFALLLIWKRRRADLPNGLLTGIFLVALFTQRFINEFFKINQVSFEDAWWINMGQLLSLPFILIGLFLIVRSRTSPLTR